MKKNFFLLGFLALLITVFSISAFVPQNDKGNKGQSQNQGKGNQGNKGNKGNQDNKGNQGNQGNKGNQGNQGDKGNQGNQDNDGPGNSDNKGKKDNGVVDNDPGKGKKVKVKDNGVYIWDRETFRDRKNQKSNEKVTLCHKVNRSGDPGVTISVSSNALKAHMNHGDVMGSCPTVNDRRYSDIFNKRRTDYYNYLQNGQEQVLYSQSVLDYALQRLAESRLQLAEYQRSGMPVDDINRKQATVVELEQNVGLLETLLTAAATLLVDRL